MIDPEYYPDIEDDEDLKLYIDAALKFVDEALHFTGTEDGYWKVYRELYRAKLDLEDALKKLKEKEAPDADR